MAREDYKYKQVDGKKVELTDDEIDELVAAETAHENEKPARSWKRLRRVRNEKLSESDYMANSDVTMSSAWKTYRQELRDLPSTLNDTTVQETITWPTEPS